MDAREWDLIVLGGGLAGLAFAYEAALRGKTVALLESEAEVGGLARTLAFGGYRFDIGGHRFHSAWPHVTRWLRELLGDDLLEVPRRSRIRLNGRYVDYPVQFPSALTAFNPAQATLILGSYVKASLQRAMDGRRPEVSFEDWVVHRFGQGLYDIYFRPYTEKVWGMPCTELSSDWASERIQLPSLTAAVKGSLFPAKNGAATLVSRFLYPRLGIGMIPQRLAEKAEVTGRATISCNSRVTRLERDEGAGTWRVHYRQGERELSVAGRRVVSSIPLPDLLRMLPPSGGATLPPADGLEYRGLICVLLAAGAPRISADTWTYFPDAGIGFGRTHEPPNWSPEMAPAGETSLCVEVFSSEGDSTWSRPDTALVEGVAADLARLGVLPRERVREAWVLRVPSAYPSYRIGYRERLESVCGHLGRHWPTLHLLGRTGTFRYMNMDAVIHQALEMAQALAVVP